MVKFYKSKLSNKLKIQKRAVVRTIDFLVSFVLFIILLTQFYLIIIDLNLNLASTSTQENNPAQLFADKLFGSTGTANWGTSTSLPSQIGLSSGSNQLNLGYYLDLAKLAHLNQELNNPYIKSNYKYINPTSILTNFSQTSNTAFRLSTKPPIQVVAKLNTVLPATSTSITVTTLSWSNITLTNITVQGYVISFSNGAFISSDVHNTSIYGNCNVVNTGLATNTNYLAVLFAHAGDSWGISWIVINNTGTTITSQNMASFSLNNPTIGKNSILQIANNSLGYKTDFMRLSTAYYNKQSNSLVINSTALSSGTGSLNVNETAVGSSSPVIQVISLVHGSAIYYRVVTQPLILNNFNYNPLLNKDLGTSQYPVYETPNFSTVNSSALYTYTTTVMTDRGPIIVSLELAGL